MATVLIVDDNAENLYLLETLLRGNGFNVTTATNGAEALESARKTLPDIIISDILMPVMDGFSLCRQWKADEQLKHIPFVIYTATYTEPKEERFATDLGADRFLIKPQEPEVLMQVLAELVEKRHTAVSLKPLGEEMEFFRQHNEILFNKLEKKMVDLEIANQRLKKNEEDLQKNEVFLDGIIENIPHMIFVKEAETLRFVRFNKAGEELLGQNRQDLIGKNDYDLFPKEQADFFTGNDRKVLESKQMVDIPEEPIETRKLGGRIVHTKKVPIIERQGRMQYLLGISEDITERKQMEDALRRSEEKYRGIFENAVMGIFRTTPEGRFLSINPAGARMYGYESREEMMQLVTDMAHQIYVHPEDRQRFKDLIGGRGSVEDFEAEHYRKDGSRIWVSMNARVIRDASGAVLHYETTSQNITGRKRVEEELRQTLEKLRKNLIGTIHALSVTVETRDPYTAGHQRKVSRLARAIAQEMNLSKDTVEHIRLAGSVHDLGKISVPAEILVRPGKLTALEMSIIKVHPQAGYDILKDVDLPYPIAEIVHQHHERLDGSGYPQGLKDGQILTEACILAVADVVEAMASHRPYRPAMGIDAALEEIEAKKGVFYHEKAVDACVRLFREKGFIFETAA
ncbi:MAG: Cyclic di-GMP phosphodiesterase response regulator RpfG [Syntrophorhabdus sp. PtaU1.Bin058]|nr:MAG: Cyclic di-GMP phosphodiesterase response regulator RpfG [Syntrophorhabdus sp. PtaU1.Bin058]